MRELDPEEQAELDNQFTYHAPTGPKQLAAYEQIRQAGKHLAETIKQHTVPCADATAAVRKIREAVMTANAAIATGMGAEHLTQ